MLEEYLGDDFVDGLYEVIQFRKGELGVIKGRKGSKDKQLYDRNNDLLGVILSFYVLKINNVF